MRNLVRVLLFAGFVALAGGWHAGGSGMLAPRAARVQRRPRQGLSRSALREAHAEDAGRQKRQAISLSSADAESKSSPGREFSWENSLTRFSLLPRALLTKGQSRGPISKLMRSAPGFFMVKRTLKIWLFLTAVFVKSAFTSAAPGAGSADDRELARNCKEGLIALGPTFVKLGQLLSTRVDVMPKAFIDELSTLQDEVPPFPLSDVKRIVAAELGEDAFADFDETPLAAASLGQVHPATTKEGERVAVKVQRPGLEDLFRVDLKNLQVLSELATILDRTPDRVLRDWREIFAQNARIIYEEIDYERELNNTLTFANNFKDVPWLRVPKVYPAYSSKRVLTMEYVPGTKISNVDECDRLGLDRPQLATYCCEMYLLQLLRYGFFHCDPHPGNVAVEPWGASDSAGGGRIILYDYGMMGTLSPQLKGGLVRGFFAVYEKDYKNLAQALYDAELLGQDTDRLSVEMIARYFIDSFSERFAMDERKAPATKEERDAMRIAAMQSIGQELAAIGGEKPFRYPEAFPFILRAFTALEGIGKSLDPGYDVYRIASRYVKELVDLKDGNAALTVAKDVQKRLGLRQEDLFGLVLFPRKITKLDKLADRVESGELKLRVRALEVERALFRNNLMTRATIYSVFACLLVNTACLAKLCLGRAVDAVAVPALGAGAAYCVVRALLALAKLKRVIRDERNRYYNSYMA